MCTCTTSPSGAKSSGRCGRRRSRRRPTLTRRSGPCRPRAEALWTPSTRCDAYLRPPPLPERHEQAAKARRRLTLEVDRQPAHDRSPVADPATERRKPSLCRVGTASARARTPFRLRDGWTFDKTRPHVCRIEDVCCPLMTCTASEHTAHRMTVHTLPDTGRPRRERPRRFRWLDSQVVSRSAPPSPWVAGPRPAQTANSGRSGHLHTVQLAAPGATEPWEFSEVEKTSGGRLSPEGFK